MLAVNQASLGAQTCGDWEQTLLIDHVGRGVAWANGQLTQIAPSLTGRYVWVLDDDDVCCDERFVADLRALVNGRDPDVIMVRADHSERHGILPEDRYWEQRPELAHVGMSNFVVRRQVFQAHAAAFDVPWAADHAFISAVWDAGCYRWFWWDRLAMRVQRVSFGAPE